MKLQGDPILVWKIKDFYLLLWQIISPSSALTMVLKNKRYQGFVRENALAFPFTEGH